MNDLPALVLSRAGFLKLEIMANSDIVKKKPVALDLSTYERLSRLAAQLRIDNPGGGFVSMSVAVGVLLEGWEDLKYMANNDVEVHTASGHVDLGQPVTPFLQKHFWKSENEIK